MDLFPDAEGAPDARLEVNQSYADRYAHNKRRVHLEQLQQKYGDGQNVDLSEDDSESEDEDEDGDQLTPQTDAAILRTIQRIRNKDSSIYDSDQRVFDTEESRLAGHQFPTLERRSDKKLTLPDYQRQRMQEIIATEADPAKAYAEATMAPRKQEPVAPPTHDEEQEAARAEFVQAAQGDDDGELFSIARHDEGNDEYRRAMLGALGGSSDEPVRTLVRDNTQDNEALSKENEEFLVNYMLNRGWVDADEPQPKRDWDAEAAELDSEASFDSAADAFEHAYNFRFEDPSLAEQHFNVQSFPRHTEDSIRRPDDRRKTQRRERAARKSEEKQTKMRELDQLKSLKRQEIADKLRLLREASGSDNRIDGDAFDGIDLSSEFDPAAHDRMMQAQFNDDYYAKQDDSVKPEWEHDVDIDDILAENAEAEKPRKRKRSDAVEMDADFDSGADVKMSKKDKKAAKKAEKKAAKKAREQGNDDRDDAQVDADDMDADAQASTQDPEARRKQAQELMDEYYGLGYEDMIGDMPTRFKYASVPKADYGMSAVDILLADDADLNSVVGLKHLQPYRKGPPPKNLDKRLRQFHRDLDERYGERPKKKRLGKKERQKAKSADESKE